MNTSGKIMVTVLLLAVGSLIVGCAKRSQVEQSSSHTTHHYRKVVVTASASHYSKPKNGKLMILSPETSLAWLAEHGYSVKKTANQYIIERKSKSSSEEYKLSGHPRISIGEINLTIDENGKLRVETYQ